jgi:hypothetical protein
MEIFSIVCLVIIMFAIQHLLNWLWRQVEEDSFIPTFIVTLIGLLISWICLYHIILWGKNLI